MDFRLILQATKLMCWRIKAIQSILRINKRNRGTLWSKPLLLSFSSHFRFLFWPMKLRKYYIIVYLLFYYFLNFRLACLALQDAKNGTHENENLETYFWYFGSFDKKRSYKKWNEPNKYFLKHKILFQFPSLNFLCLLKTVAWPFIIWYDDAKPCMMIFCWYFDNILLIYFLSSFF